MYGIYYFQAYHSVWLDFYQVDSFCKIFPKKCHLMSLITSLLACAESVSPGYVLSQPVMTGELKVFVNNGQSNNNNSVPAQNGYLRTAFQCTCLGV